MAGLDEGGDACNGQAKASEGGQVKQVGVIKHEQIVARSNWGGLAFYVCLPVI